MSDAVSTRLSVLTWGLQPWCRSLQNKYIRWSHRGSFPSYGPSREPVWPPLRWPCHCDPETTNHKCKILSASKKQPTMFEHDKILFLIVKLNRNIINMKQWWMSASIFITIHSFRYSTEKLKAESCGGDHRENCLVVCLDHFTWMTPTELSEQRVPT